MEARQRAPIVALVCSAGGLEALRRVLAPLPADFPAAVLVLQHQSPTHRSLLAPILARACRLPVRDVCNGDPLASAQRPADDCRTAPSAGVMIAE